MSVSGLEAKVLKLQRISKRLQKIWGDWRNSSQKIYFHHRVTEYRDMWRVIAEKNGAKFSVLSDDLWEIELNGKTTRILNHQLEFDNPVTLGLASMKPLMHRLLKENSVHAPEHVVYKLTELDKAYEFLRSYPKGVVVKPANGTHAGDGVSTHLLNDGEIRKASILASLYCQDILIEPQVPGECYRLLVIGGKMVHAVCRRGPRLRGDGKSTVAELIASENKRLAGQNARPLDIDRDCKFTLNWQKLSLDSTPEKGQEFIVKTINDPLGRQVEIRTVYNKNVTDIICDSIREEAETAAKVLKSDFVGVDMIMTDPTISLEESGGIVNEVNTTPALHHHYDSSTEKYPKVAMEAFSLLLKK